MRRWYVLLKDWKDYKAGTRVELDQAEGDALVTAGTAKGPFADQQAAIAWKPDAAAPQTQPATPPAAAEPPNHPQTQPQPPAASQPPSPPQPPAAPHAADILAACQLHWSQQPARALEVAGELIRAGLTIDQARARIEERLRAERQPLGAMPSGQLPGQLNTLESEADKFAHVATQAFALRLARGNPNEVSAAYEYRSQVRPWMPPLTGQQAQLGHDARRLASMRLIDWAAECVFRTTGREVRHLPPATIADIAMGRGRAHGFHAAEYHSPADLPNLILDAANVMFLRAFQMADVTWFLWVQLGEPADDFKPHHFVRVSETGYIDDVPDGEKLKDKKFTDAKETLIVQTRGNSWTFTRQMLIDGNTEGMATMLLAVGRGFARTINGQVYGLLKRNPKMADGVALFHANHGNLVTGGGVPSKAQMEKIDALVAAQKDIDGVSKINAPIMFVLVPRAIWPGTAEFFASVTRPDQSNSQVPNIWNPGVYSQLTRRTQALQVVYDTELDGVANNPWYATTDWRDVPHLVVKFLRGEEAPVITEEVDLSTAGGLTMYGHQTFGVSAIESRGVNKNPGA